MHVCGGPGLITQPGPQGHVLADDILPGQRRCACCRCRPDAPGKVPVGREPSQPLRCHVEIHGGKDTIAIGIDPRTPWRSVEADAPSLAGPPYPSFHVRFADAYRAELAHFLRFARGEAEDPCTAADALEALRLAEAAGRSWRERRGVELSEVV